MMAKETYSSSDVPILPSSQLSHTIIDETVDPPATLKQPSLLSDEHEAFYGAFIGVTEISKGAITVLNKSLGAGAFGQVCQGQMGERLVALKEINVAHAQRNLGIKEEEVLEAMQWEISLLSITNHPNLVQFFGVYKDQQKTYLVMEFCTGGNLQNYLQNHPNIDKATFWQWALEITQGLVYLHHQGILHRDLKAENILLDKDLRVRLADLGVAQMDALLKQEEASVVEQGFQDARFRAPESLEGAESTPAADVYALGLVFWQLINQGKNPRRLQNFPSSTDIPWEHEPIPSSCPPAFRDLILDCWQLRPEKRPSMELLLLRLQAMGEIFHQHARSIQLCEALDSEIHPIRQELFKYLTPHLTQYRVLEDLDTYWQRIENQAPDIQTSQVINPPLQLSNVLNEFFANPSIRTLVLLGESGLGKTLSVYRLADQLLSDWWHYLSNRTSASEKAPYFPLFVRNQLKNDLSGSHRVLPRLDRLLAETGLGNEARILVILDGYDEVDMELPENLPQLMGFTTEFPNAKFLVTSRPNAVRESTLSSRFALSGHQLMVRHFLPFNLDQILRYLQTTLSWDTATFSQYRDNLKSVRQLRQVLRNPFVLSLLVQSWETITTSQKELNQLNRWQIYQGFVEHWMKDHQHLLPPPVQKTVLQGYDSILESFNSFAAEVAFRAFEQKSLTLDLRDNPSQHHETFSSSTLLWFDLSNQVQLESERNFTLRQQRSKDENQRRALLSEKDYVTIMQQRLVQFRQTGCPVNQLAGGSLLEFRHKSFFEYYVALRVVNFRKQGPNLEELLKLLNVRSLQDEPETLQFMVEAWQEPQTQVLQGPLIDVLLASRKAPSLAQASANAITFLNAARVSLSGLDLHGICVPGANLNGLIAHKTNFAKADLSGCVMIGAFLTESCLDEANLVGVRFGELPMLSWPTGCVTSLSFSSNSQELIVTGDPNTIAIYDLEKGEITRALTKHTERILGSSLDKSGGFLLTQGHLEGSYIWDLETNGATKIPNHTGRPVFIPNLPSQIAYATQDGIYQVPFAKNSGKQVGGASATTTDPMISVESAELVIPTKGKIKIEKFEYSQDGRLLAAVCNTSPNRRLRPTESGANMYQVQIWDALERKSIKDLPGYLFAFSPGNVFVAVACVDENHNNVIQVYNLLDKQFECTFLNVHASGGFGINVLGGKPRNGTVNVLLFSPVDKNILISAGEDGAIVFWDFSKSKQEPLGRFIAHGSPITCLAFSPDGDILASGSGDLALTGFDSGDRLIKLWPIMNFVTLQQQQSWVTRGHISCSITSVLNHELITGETDGSIKRWSCLDGRLLESKSVYPEVTSTTDRKVRELHLLAPNLTSSPASSQQHLFVLNESGVIKGYELNRTHGFGSEILKLSCKDHSRAFAVSQNARLLAFGGPGDKLSVLNLDTLEPVFSSNKAYVTALAFSSESTGPLLAVSGENLLKVMNTNGEIVFEPTELKRTQEYFGVGTVTFSPTEPTFIFCYDFAKENELTRTSVVMWDTAHRRKCFDWIVHRDKDGCGCQLVVSPSGQYFASGNTLGEVVIIDIRSKKEAGRFFLGQPHIESNAMVVGIHFMDDQTLLTSQRSGAIKAWNLQKHPDDSFCVLLKWHTSSQLVVYQTSFEAALGLTAQQHFMLTQKGRFRDRGRLSNLALHQSIIQGETAKAIQLIEGASVSDLSTLDSTGLTALHWAIETKSFQIIEQLVRKSTQLAKVPSSKGVDPLVFALNKGREYFEAVKMILYAFSEGKQFRASLEYLADNGADAYPWFKEYLFYSVQLLQAASLGDLAGVKRSVDAGGSVKFREHRYGCTPFFIAAAGGHLDMALWLLEHGASMDETNQNGATAMHGAAQHGHLEIIKYFLQKNLFPFDVKNSDGYNVLDMALLSNHPKLARWLIEYACKSGDPTLLRVSWKSQANFFVRKVSTFVEVSNEKNGWRTPLNESDPDYQDYVDELTERVVWALFQMSKEMGLEYEACSEARTISALQRSSLHFNILSEVCLLILPTSSEEEAATSKSTTASSSTSSNQKSPSPSLVLFQPSKGPLHSSSSQKALPSSITFSARNSTAFFRLSKIIDDVDQISSSLKALYGGTIKFDFSAKKSVLFGNEFKITATNEQGQSCLFTVHKGPPGQRTWGKECHPTFHVIIVTDMKTFPDAVKNQMFEIAKKIGGIISQLFGVECILSST